MWTPTEFSYRKFARKREAEGMNEALLASCELATRKLLAPPLIRNLIDFDIVETVERSNLDTIANNIYHFNQHSKKHQPLKSNQNSDFVTDIADGGYVLPETGLGTDIDGRIISETAGPPQENYDFTIEAIVWHLFSNPRVAIALLQGKTSSFETYAKSIDIACPLSPRYVNYYHWMVQTVPKLRYMREYESEVEFDVTYLVPPKAPSWVDETLKLLGVHEEKIEQATAPIYRADRLLIPSYPQSTVEDYQWLKSKILNSASPDRDMIASGKNIYISRQNAIERRVVNEEEVVNALSEFGFECYLLEKQTVAENVTLFNEADLIVGPHGAGLTDILFCENATTIELFGSKYQNAYKKLANTLNLEYHQMNCQPESTDILVNTDRLERIVADNITPN